MDTPLDRLISALSRLPGIGRRSAERAALKLIAGKETLLKELAASLEEAARRIVNCSRCGAISADGSDPCRYCRDTSRDQGILYVVEDASDVFALERAGGVKGMYHVLGGKISPMEGKGPWDLRLKRLIERIDEGNCREVVLALNTDMESDATAAFIQDLLRERHVTVSRLAFGLPVGSGIAYSDPVTLQRAINGRQNVAGSGQEEGSGQ